MPIRSNCIRKPLAPVPRNYIPSDSYIKRKALDGESWVTIAQDVSTKAGMSLDPWYVIRFNYPTLPKDIQQAEKEVNWYLQEYVGCTQLTPDSTNYVFSSKDPGYIYVPDIAGPVIQNGPELTSIKDRRESIMANTAARFVVKDDPTVKASPEHFWYLQSFEEVTANSTNIEMLAKQYGLDPDFVKAIVWIETTHGYYDRIDPWNKTIRPMNVHYRLWSDLGITKESVDKAFLNTATGVHILAMIWERTVDAKPEKVATLYNQLGATSVNVYGKTVAKYMAEKPWLTKVKK